MCVEEGKSKVDVVKGRENDAAGTPEKASTLLGFNSGIYRNV